MSELIAEYGLDVVQSYMGYIQVSAVLCLVFWVSMGK